jgi:hypothetical protein
MLQRKRTPLPLQNTHPALHSVLGYFVLSQYQPATNISLERQDKISPGIELTRVLLPPLLPETAKSMKLKRNSCLRLHMVKLAESRTTRGKVQETRSSMFICLRYLPGLANYPCVEMFTCPSSGSGNTSLASRLGRSWTARVGGQRYSRVRQLQQVIDI